MKRGLNKRQITKPITLTKKVARVIISRIEKGLPLYNRRSRYLLIEDYKIPKNTYSSWLRTGMVPVDTPHTYSLSERVAKAKMKGLTERAKRDLKSGDLSKIFRLQKLPNTITEYSCRRSSNKGFKETELTRSIDPRLISIKRESASHILERLGWGYN